MTECSVAEGGETQREIVLVQADCGCILSGREPLHLRKMQEDTEEKLEGISFAGVGLAASEEAAK